MLTFLSLTNLGICMFLSSYAYASSPRVQLPIKKRFIHTHGYELEIIEQIAPPASFNNHPQPPCIKTAHKAAKRTDSLKKKKNILPAVAFFETNKPNTQLPPTITVTIVKKIEHPTGKKQKVIIF